MCDPEPLYVQRLQPSPILRMTCVSEKPDYRHLQWHDGAIFGPGKPPRPNHIRDLSILGGNTSPQLDGREIRTDSLQWDQLVVPTIQNLF